MNLKQEQEYIKNFINNMSDEELRKAMDECGNHFILPTKEIYTALQKNGFYDNMSQYVMCSNYIETNMEKWSRFLISDHRQGAAA